MGEEATTDIKSLILRKRLARIKAHRCSMANEPHNPTKIQKREWYIRRDHWSAALVAVALIVKRERGVRSAARLLIEGNVSCWVSARVLSTGGAIRADDDATYDLD